MSYFLGRRACLMALGIDKVASLPVPAPVEPEDKGLSTGQALAMTGAAASPFAGMIGEKKFIHDPVWGAKGTRFSSMNELARAAQPGDVLVTTKAKSPFKRVISPVSGSEWYHAQPVLGRRQGHGTTISAGELDSAGVRNPERDRSLMRELKDTAGKIPAEMEGAHYDDVVLLRPKKPLSKQELRKFVDRSIARSTKNYDMGQAISAWARDIFVPKINNPLARNMVQCEGNVCSTIPAQALYEASGRKVVEGKRPQHVMPQDFLRSDEYELIGSRLKNRSALGGALLKSAPYLSRAAIGGGLAGGTYLASENPEVAGAALGAAGGSALGSAVYKHLYPKAAPYTASSNPTIAEAISPLFFESELPKATVYKNFARRRLPWLAAGGAAGALGAHLLSRIYGKGE